MSKGKKEEPTKEELFKWIADSRKGFNCVVFGCKNPPVCLCLCGYHYCEKHIDKIPEDLDPHSEKFREKWGNIH